MVRQDLVPKSKIIEGDAVTIRCAHDDTVLYPIAHLQLEVDGLSVYIEAAVSKSLPVPVLLGIGGAELHQLLGESTAYPQIKECMMLVTHTQAMQQLQEGTNTRSKEHECGTKPHTLVKVSEEPESIGGEFDDGLFSPS